MDYVEGKKFPKLTYYNGGMSVESHQSKQGKHWLYSEIWK